VLFRSDAFTTKGT